MKHPPQRVVHQGGDRVCGRKDPAAVFAEHSLSRREGRLPLSEEGEDLAAELERSLAQGARGRRWRGGGENTDSRLWCDRAAREGGGVGKQEAGDAVPQVAASAP